MKRIAIYRLLLLTFACCAGVYTAGATCGLTSNSGWRWRNDDGSETSATWRAAQNVGTTYAGGGRVLRLRIQVNNTRRSGTNSSSCGDYIPAPFRDSLQYSTTPTVATSWVTVTNSIANAFALAGSATPYVVQDEATTPQLTGYNPNPIFSPGRVMTNAIVIDETIPASTRTEYEWAIKGTGNMRLGTVYYFKQKTAFSLATTASAFPSLITPLDAPLPVKLARFVARKEGKKVKLEWTTASEEASERFAALRSANGQDWKAIAQVQSRGNATTPTDYLAYDDQPLSGLSYYRLKQMDKDGKTSLSDVKAIQFFADAAVSVWPNPASSHLNFSLQQPAANVLATLLNATGHTVLQERFVGLPAGAVNKWTWLQKLPTGVYVLKLEADAFSEIRKVIIQ